MGKRHAKDDKDNNGLEAGSELKLLPAPPTVGFLPLEPLFEAPRPTIFNLTITPGSNLQPVLALSLEETNYKSFQWTRTDSDHLDYVGRYGPSSMKVSITTAEAQIYQEGGNYWYRLLYEWLQSGDVLGEWVTEKAVVRKIRWSTFDSVPTHLWDFSTWFAVSPTVVGRAGTLNPRPVMSTTPTPQTIFEQAASIVPMFPRSFYVYPRGRLPR